ncbi:MAG: DNA-binding domain-containing protein [Burkholderiaceae bacterium]
MNAGLLSVQARFQQHMLGMADATPLLAGPDERRALGLAIYAHAYRQRLVEALADAFAKTRALLGAEAFEAAALHYIHEYPPETRNLRWFGAEFAAHLRGGFPTQAAVAELAQLDWALRQAFDGADSPVLVAADLAGVAPEAWAYLQLVPVPTTTLLRFGHNTVALWQSIDDEAEAPAIVRGEVAVDWLVWRKGLQPHFRSLHPVEAALLRAMLGGTSFAQACEQAQAQTAEDCTSHIGSSLGQWLDDSVLSAVLMPAVHAG